jgi:hypothetical protein
MSQQELWAFFLKAPYLKMGVDFLVTSFKKDNFTKQNSDQKPLEGGLLQVRGGTSGSNFFNRT